MPSSQESPKSVFRRLPRTNLAKFKVNVRGASESTTGFLARNRIAPEGRRGRSVNPCMAYPV